MSTLLDPEYWITLYFVMCPIIFFITIYYLRFKMFWAKEEAFLASALGTIFWPVVFGVGTLLMLFVLLVKLPRSFGFVSAGLEQLRERYRKNAW